VMERIDLGAVLRYIDSRFKTHMRFKQNGMLDVFRAMMAFFLFAD